jgi:L,D-transpeptidase YcbB
MSGIASRFREYLRLRCTRAMPLALLLAVLATPHAYAPAAANPRPGVDAAQLRDEIASRVDSDLRPFYAARGYRPLWIGANGRHDPAVAVLLRHLETAELDAVKKKPKTNSLRKALRRGVGGDADDLARVEVKLSEAFVDYVSAMRAAPHGEMIFASEALAPVVPTAGAALSAAATASSLAGYLEKMGWMHPIYAPMRDALLDRRYSGHQRSLIWQNLARIRALPATRTGRYVLVDAATARLWMYEDGKPVDSMRVVVGKAETPTPAMAGFLLYAVVKPYWNVPPGLIRQTIATNVLEKGLGYLEAGGYQVLSDWSDNPGLVPPESIDWLAVAAGTQRIRVRQLPGGSNFMGKVKFEFPNAEGIYLHDTPDKHLMHKDLRQFSNGCVRLEDADRFGRWLLGKRLPHNVSYPEHRVDLPQLVPIYITYLTAMPEGGRITFRSDVYGWDGTHRLARSE